MAATSPPPHGRSTRPEEVPAWANSLFEDNAEFGLGMRLGLEAMEADAHLLLTALLPELGQLGVDMLEADQSDELGIAKQRQRVEDLREMLAGDRRPPRTPTRWSR